MMARKANADTGHVPMSNGEGSITAGPVDKSAAASPVVILDLVHLSRQTFGDPALERDVLALFAQQAASIEAALARNADPAERARLCHLIGGSARGIGATEVADLAAHAEAHPADGTAIAGLVAGIGRARAHIATLLPG